MKYLQLNEINAEAYEITDGGKKIRDGSMDYEKVKTQLERIQGANLSKHQRDRLHRWIDVVLGKINIVPRSLP